MLDRQVLQIDPPPEQGSEVTLFSAHANAQNLVVLGDPGSGKSSLFKAYSAKESGCYFTVRDFLNTPSDEVPRDQILWIDALDETRSGRSDQSTVDQLTRKLAMIRPKGMRLSCRVADWLDQTDLAALRPYFNKSGEATVVQLLALTKSEQMSVLASSCYDDAERFVEEAIRRQLDPLLENPHTLLLLAKVVQQGNWPLSQTELFDRAVLLLLDEQNPLHAEKDLGPGRFTAKELLSAAGALCALRLLSNCQGFSLAASSDDESIACYREIDLAPKPELYAALSRRAFISIRQGGVDYTHRTIAEFLAARYLIRQLSSGISLGRLLALLGIEERPPTALRGLFAWLVTLIADPTPLMDYDPVGVLLYGDVSNWSSANRLRLVDALASHSKQDPWFLSRRHLPDTAKALADPALAQQYQYLFTSSESSLSLRLFVLSLQKGCRILPGFTVILKALVGDVNAHYALRVVATEVLHEGDDASRQALLTAYSQLGSSEDDLRLRSACLHAHLGDGLNADDFVAFWDDLESCEEQLPIGITIGLLEHVDHSMAKEILQKIQNRVIPNSSIFASRRGPREASRLYERLLAIALPVSRNPQQSYDWLKFYLRRAQHHGQDGSLAKAFKASSDLGRESLRAALVHADFSKSDENSWLRFILLIRPWVNVGDMLEEMLQAIHAAHGERRALIYRAALSESVRLGEVATVHSTNLSALAELDPLLGEVQRAWRAQLNQMPDFVSQYAQEEARQTEAWRVSIQANFEQNAAAVSSASDLGLLEEATEIYFWHDRPQSAAAPSSPRLRLEWALGEQGSACVLRGFEALLIRVAPPELSQLLADYREKRSTPWTALLAALDVYRDKDGEIKELPDTLLASALMIEAIFPVYVHTKSSVDQWRHVWVDEVIEAKTVLAADTYLAFLANELAQHSLHPHCLMALGHPTLVGNHRGRGLVQLLHSYPLPKADALTQILLWIQEDGVWHAIKSLALETVNLLQAKSSLSSNELQCLGIWLWFGFTNDPIVYQPILSSLSSEQLDVAIWEILEEGVEAGFGSHKVWSYTLSQLEFAVTWAASRYPQTAHPVGGSMGTRNPWDASMHIQSMIAQIASLTSHEARMVMARLVQSSELESYRDSVLHHKANQLTTSVDASHVAPSWEVAQEALANRAPHSHQDMVAVVLDHLGDVQRHISHGNEDPYKLFWNTDSANRLDRPKTEDQARDALLGMLRYRLSPHELRAEPEGHMSADKRADIVISGRNIKAVIEIKRDFHVDVWTAAIEQLDRLYTPDPEAGGLGIYLVFWYSEKRTSMIPTPPNGNARPQSAGEMRLMLQEMLPNSAAKRIKIMVMDVSGPGASRAN
ncbi:hypothetical protein P2C08_17055 [Xanthomonas perforans]